ncbi:MAG: hypothetical protein CR982_09100 [Candidatus Cloacimonadota bacterium]|nr:MAG: hypothetical protein CR982_09100 [Candidatus Cloacimonadota bacterium]PIE78623.1 MAG: hypothetical protein CSA15_06995 [Candidatus Delongbacteria bacterium]
MSKRPIYRFGLYGRCPQCKEITAVKCSFCGEREYFTDSSKPGYVLCANCNTHNKVTCTKDGCKNQTLVLRTPKNEDEQYRILEFIKRKKDKKRDRRRYDLKVDEVKENEISDAEIVQNKISIEEKPDKKDFKIDFSKAKEIALALEEEKKKQSKENNTSNEKSKVIKEERRIVNQFYDQDHDETIDKKTNFPLEYKDTVYFNCHICGKSSEKIICSICGKSEEFSLDYDLLSCSCGNEMKLVECSCGAKHSIGKFYLKYGDIEWRYNNNKSYYRYRKGRLLAFSTCPSCGIFMVERCVTCGSKVNFGEPNINNEVYCKNCGTVNQFRCGNKGCNNIVKETKNPTSIEEKYDWLNKAMDINEQKNLNKAESGKTSFTTSFIEEVEKNTKIDITSSFIDEAKKEVTERKQIEEDLAKHNIKQIEYSFSGNKKRGSKVYLYIAFILLLAGGAFYYYKFLYQESKEPVKAKVNSNVKVDESHLPSDLAANKNEKLDSLNSVEKDTIEITPDTLLGNNAKEESLDFETKKQLNQ